MSKAEELLNSVSEEVSVHTHPVPDTDTYFIIDPITRRIENTNRKKSVIMQYDHNSERFTFELPRFVDGHDMLECTSVTVNVDNIEAVESDGVEVVEPRVNSDAPDMTDLRVHPDDPDKVISSWLISRNSTQLAGILSFHIEYKCVDSNGTVVYEWGTDTYDEIEVKARKKNGESVVVEYADVLEQWRTRIFGAGDSVMANIAAEGEAQVAAVKSESETQQEAVELKGVQTLDSIPDDYAEVNAMADEAVRSKGDAIVCEAAGESIVLKDSSNDYIRGLKIFGKSSQKTTIGKNLLDASKLAVSGIEVSGNTVKVYPSSNGQAVVSPLTLGETLSASVGETVVLSGTTTGSNLIYIIDAETSWHFGSSIVLTETMLASQVFLYGADIGTQATITNLMVRYPGTDDTYEPYTGGKPSPNPEYPQAITSVENSLVGIYGKNLIDVDAIEGVMNKKVSVSPDKYTLTVTGGMGKSYSYSYYNMPIDLVRLLEGKPLRLSIDSTTKTVANAYCPVQLNISTSDKTTIYPVCHGGQLQHDFVMPRNVVECKIGVYTNNASTPLDVDNTVVFNGLRLTLQDTPEYEPYKPYQTVTLTRTLPGIPVTSGGNYTDSDGQQWICDEVDLERGVYVQRVAIEELSKVSAFNDYGLYCTLFKGRSKYDIKFLCTHANSEISFANGQTGAYISCVIYKKILPASVIDIQTGQAWINELKDAGTPFTVAYILTTPIETPLTAEEITAFKALRTNYPNTTILNDAGAWMSVKYNADTKLYIDNKITSAINAYLDAHLNH